jgi:ferredoxin
LEELKMAYVITEPCIGVKDTGCVDVCPADAIHPRRDEIGFLTASQLFINADECICCGWCESECPVGAIYEEYAVPEEYKKYIALNMSYRPSVP